MGLIDQTSHQLWISHPECVKEAFEKKVFKNGTILLDSIRPIDIKGVNTAIGKTTYRDNLFSAVFREDSGQERPVILAIEDSAYIDHGIVRNILARDAMTYTQCDLMYNSGKKLTGDELLSKSSASLIYPRVYTIYHNWSMRHWDGPVHMLDKVESVSPNALRNREVIPPYTVVTPQEFSMKEIRSFSTVLREIYAAMYWVEHKTERNRILGSRQFHFKELDAVAFDQIVAVTGSKAVRENFRNDEGGTYNMCKAFDELLEEEAEKKARKIAEAEIKAEVKKVKQALAAVHKKEVAEIRKEDRAKADAIRKEDRAAHKKEVAEIRREERARADAEIKEMRKKLKQMEEKHSQLLKLVPANTGV